MIQIASKFFHFDHFLGATPIGNGNINDTYRLDFEAGGAKKTVLLQRFNHPVCIYTSRFRADGGGRIQ